MSAPLPTPYTRFVFSGNAVAFAGRIRRPNDDFIPSAAASHIPVSGGHCEMLLDTPEALKPFHYKELISFSSAYSRVRGDYLDTKLAMEFTNNNHGDNNLPAHTSVESHLKDLKVDQVDAADPSARRTFTAKLLQVQMTSTANRLDPVSFSSLGVKYENIQLATGGATPATLVVETDTEVFTRHDTKRKLVDAYQDTDFRKRYSHMLLPLGEEDKKGISGILAHHDLTHADKSYFVATLVKRLRWDGPTPERTEIQGNRLTIQGFGRIFFGEVIIKDNERRVTLLRFELGSPHGGDGTACDVGSNGGGFPPSS